MQAARPARASPPASRCGGRCWFILEDPCGLVCVALTYLIAICTSGVVNACVLWPLVRGALSLIHALAYNFVILAMLLSHARCMLVNPGTARDHLETELLDMMRHEFSQKREKAEDTDRFDAHGMLSPPSRRWWCTKCDTFRPRHTHHCSTCRSCVLEMDHHCPWVNNCVGWRNHKYFVLFLFYALVGCIWSAGLIIIAFVNPPEPVLRHLEMSELISVGDTRGTLPILHRNIWFQLACAVNCIVCILLAIFTCVMTFDQWEYMAHGFGVIDKKQREREQMKVPRVATCCPGNCDKLPYVMGGPFGPKWLLPLAPGERDLAFVASEDAVVAQARRRLLEENGEAVALLGDGPCSEPPPYPTGLRARNATSATTPSRSLAYEEEDSDSEESSAEVM